MSDWQPIETCPLGAEALFMGRLWRHPYWGIRNGDDGMVWIDGVGDANWQASDAAWWMPLDAPGVETGNQASNTVIGSGPSEAKK